MIGKHPNGPFCSRIWGNECWGDELERGGGQSLWGDSQSQGQGECTTHSGGARDTGANEISGDERLPVK